MFYIEQKEIIKNLKDGKIHIVAAPGSGKTILGLELIKRLNAPALILSPSVTIRQQWGERFCEAFLPENENAENFISYNLKEPKLLTSITYQALHAAYTKTNIDEEADDEEFENEEAADFTNFEILDLIKTAGIKTICLDEAHHLKSEWQKALEKFIDALGGSVKLISLTATPPYDSAPQEWAKYSSLCGEIDEEIFVPQLVSQKTLCPHQDYIYFSYPTEDELNNLNESCYSNVLLAAILSTNTFIKYPNPVPFKTHFDIDGLDINDNNISYFKYCANTNSCTIENLKNLRLEDDIYKWVLVDEAIKYVIRSLNLDEYRGRLYSPYVKLQIDTRVKRLMEEMKGVVFKQYTIETIQFVKTAPAVGYINIKLSIVPFGTLEKINIVMGV